MTVEQAAQSLSERLQNASWVSAIGVGQHSGQPCIYVYVRSLKAAKVEFREPTWQGYTVILRQFGTPRPADTLRIKLASG